MAFTAVCKSNGTHNSCEKVSTFSRLREYLLFLVYITSRSCCVSIYTPITMAKTFKSVEYIDDSDPDIMDLASSSPESESESEKSSETGSTTVAEEPLQARDCRDSIDRELDAMERPPPEASIPAMAAVPPAQHRKQEKASAYIQVFSG
jgi:hypothetical protein